jgi:hypothetical protein
MDYRGHSEDVTRLAKDSGMQTFSWTRATPDRMLTAPSEPLFINNFRNTTASTVSANI